VTASTEALVMLKPILGVAATGVIAVLLWKACWFSSSRSLESRQVYSSW
jgi:hypothetical protein